MAITKTEGRYRCNEENTLHVNNRQKCGATGATCLLNSRSHLLQKYFVQINIPGLILQQDGPISGSTCCFLSFCFI